MSTPNTTPAGRLDRTLPAIGYAAAGVLSLCLMDAVIKHLVQEHNALVVAFGRHAFSVLFALPVWLHTGAPRITADMWRAHALRGIAITGLSLTFFYALSVLPLAEATAAFFMAPLLIPFFAWVLLGERIHLRSILACALGFVGVLVAVSGEAGQTSHPQHALGVAAALAGAVLYALSMAMLRGRAEKDGAAIVGLLTSLAPVAFLAGPALLAFPLPALSTLPAFAAMGAFGAIGIYLLSKGYAAAQAQILAPLEFTALIWAAVIGLVFFAETPEPRLWVGAVLVIAACLWGTSRRME